MDQDDEVIDIEGDFKFDLGPGELGDGVYDTNELPSKSANLQPEYVHHPWVLEQGWSLDPAMDEKSKATIEKMLQEEQNGRGNTSKIHSSSKSKSSPRPSTHNQPWSEEEKSVFEAALQTHGRKWKKIAELIPTRTTLQVKNYGQQYFKVQRRQVSSSLSSASSRKSIMDSLKCQHPPEAFQSIEKILAAMSSEYPSQATADRRVDQNLPTDMDCEGRISHSIECDNLPGPSYMSLDTRQSIVNVISDIRRKGGGEELSIDGTHEVAMADESVGGCSVQNFHFANDCTVNSEPISDGLQSLKDSDSEGGISRLNPAIQDFVEHVKLKSKQSEMTHYTIQNGCFVPKENLSTTLTFDDDKYNVVISDSDLLMSGGTDIVVGNNVEIDGGHELQHDNSDGSSDAILNETVCDGSGNDGVVVTCNENMENNVASISSNCISEKNGELIGPNQHPDKEVNYCVVGEEKDVCDGSGLAFEKATESEESDVDIDIDSESENEFMAKCKSSATEIYKKLIEEASISLAPSSKELHDEQKLCSASTNDSFKVQLCRTDSEGKMCESLLQTQGEYQRSRSQSIDGDSDSQLSECSSQSSITGPQCGVLNSRGEFVPMTAPVKPVVFDRNHVTEEEREIHFEFFDGRSGKTQERYLKIRNYILDAWEKSKPGYVYKTVVRSGLKNCGDVNCFGRIHTYLEQKGAINFGCEQANYFRYPRMFSNSSRHDRAVVNSQVLHFERLETMRPRKRRVKDKFGQWIPESELEGKTIDHAENTLEVTKVKPKKSRWDKLKNPQCRAANGDTDPFQLIPCRSFTADVSAPFHVHITSSTLVLMEVHAHVSKAEVIGLLGGVFCDNVLQVLRAEPCHSLSTGMQCEMDPVSQTLASEAIVQSGMRVVGWYHSHPTFEPNPSLRDIETQQEFQTWFSKGGQHFVGIIVNPYRTTTYCATSDIRCLTVVPDSDTGIKVPYQFPYEVQPSLSTTKDQSLNQLSTLVKEMSSSNNRVDMFTPIVGTDTRFIEKLEAALWSHMTLDSEDLSADVIRWVNDLFYEYWKSDDAGEKMNNSTDEIDHFST